jgi:hypothetical protein
MPEQIELLPGEGWQTYTEAYEGAVATAVDPQPPNQNDDNDA